MPLKDVGSCPSGMSEFVLQRLDVNAELGEAPATDIRRLLSSSLPDTGLAGFPVSSETLP